MGVDGKRTAHGENDEIDPKAELPDLQKSGLCMSLSIGSICPDMDLAPF